VYVRYAEYNHRLEMILRDNEDDAARARQRRLGQHAPVQAGLGWSVTMIPSPPTPTPGPPCYDIGVVKLGQFNAMLTCASRVHLQSHVVWCGNSMQC
jgi:hypothetical protein